MRMKLSVKTGVFFDHFEHFDIIFMIWRFLPANMPIRLLPPYSILIQKFPRSTFAVRTLLVSFFLFFKIALILSSHPRIHAPAYSLRSCTPVTTDFFRTLFKACLLSGNSEIFYRITLH